MDTFSPINTFGYILQLSPMLALSSITVNAPMLLFSPIEAESETVADEACADLMRHHQARNKEALDPYLADQIILPLALANGESEFTTSYITKHTMTNIAIVRQFLDTEIRVVKCFDGGRIFIKGIGYHV